MAESTSAEAGQRSLIRKGGLRTFGKGTANRDVRIDYHAINEADRSQIVYRG